MYICVDKKKSVSASKDMVINLVKKTQAID